MTKIVKVGSDWFVEEIESLVDELAEAGIDAFVVCDDELEVYDGDLKNITINGEDVKEYMDSRFTGDTLYGVQ